VADKYVIGIDFGTESGRAVLVRVADGEEIASAVYKYENGVIDERLPFGGPPLPPDFALQDPDDYIRTIEHTIPTVLSAAGAEISKNVVGIGIDFTACTMLPVRAGEGLPLCREEKFRRQPHAWVKLWKHHAAQGEANALNEVAARRGEAFLPRYGGKISSEWFFPKVWETLKQAPEVYEAADRFIEAADWVVWQLTGVETRNACTAGYKAIWSKREGFPSADFFAALNPRLRRVVDEKMSRTILPAGTCAGGLTPAWAEKLGLLPGIAVAVANVDAHVAVPACTVVSPGKMVMVMGTSICHMVLGNEERFVPGMCGVVEDGILPGYFGYEAGQSAVGDIFAWFVENGVPARYAEEAEARGLSLYSLMEEKAAGLKPGESGLLALDWWNGNRSILVDADLSGLIIGYHLQTTAGELYRTLLEATAFGTQTIISAFVEHGVPVEELYACGGLPEKSPLLMQIFADVTGKPIKVAASAQTPALGSAMFAAVAAGPERGGHRSIIEAAQAMARLKDRVYRPNPEAHAVYKELYAEYVRLHDYFGRDQGSVMKRLRRIKGGKGK